MSLEMAHKVILPPKKNYIPQFLKQRDINSYSIPHFLLCPWRLSTFMVRAPSSVHSGDSNSCPTDQELGILAKMAS
jgi:hypothetical protein